MIKNRIKWLKQIVVMILMLVTITNTVSGAEVSKVENIVDIGKGASYSSKDYYNMAQKLVERYPNILQLEVIGKSIDNKPIYTIVMTENVKETMVREDINVYREHYYVEAGTHAREIANSTIVMKQIEDYCVDYYNDKHIKEFNVKNELNKAIIHFIPLVNPDGHDLVKFGSSSITTKAGLDSLKKVKDTYYKRFKANAAGVDLNRNYPDVYYDIENKVWVNKFQKYPSPAYLVKNEPWGEFYSGTYGGSEPETQAVMKYLSKYDFRNILSYHSMGSVVYWGKAWFSDTYNKRVESLSKVASKVTGYPTDYSEELTGSGYFSDFVASETLKPMVTIETTKVQAPTPQKYFAQAYKENYLVPLYFIQEGRSVGYHKYRLYVNDKYVRDFEELVYAEAHASRYENAKIVEDIGVPKYTLIKPISREEVLHKLIGKYYDITRLLVDATDTFEDTKDVITTFARNKDILSSSEKFRPKDTATSLEVAIMIYNIHKEKEIETTKSLIYQEQKLNVVIPTWAEGAVKYVIYNQILPEKVFINGVFDQRFLD